MTDKEREEALPSVDPEQAGERGQPGSEPGPIEGPTTVLVVAAHPDDPEFGCGGTSALWASQGKEVYYVVATSGDKGSSDPEMTSETLVKLREAEQREAACAIGVKKVFFLRLPDGELQPNLVLRRAIVKAIRLVRPEIVVTHDPTNVYSDQGINHPDHQAVGHATLHAVYPTARDRLNFPEHEREGLRPHKVREVYLWGAREPNVWIDISESFDAKVRALTCHRTQIQKPEELAKRMRERSESLAQRYQGDGHVPKLAEAFRKISMTR
ncbi:MAG TPA: PIG-L deacetylase family protein [Chloroflexota bacterium]